MKLDYRQEYINGRNALTVSGLGRYSLEGTLECGQCFRHERIPAKELSGYTEYMTVVGKKVISVGQRREGELIFFGITEDELPAVARYFALDRDLKAIKERILSGCSSEWMALAADSSEGIAILRQDPWEALFSFIISQNNNIPRIRKIIREICATYGVNLILHNQEQSPTPCKESDYSGSSSNTPVCPLSGGECREEVCRQCGRCYSFPTPEDILRAPEKMLSSKPGFRYKYLLDAAEKCHSGELDLCAIDHTSGYLAVTEELKRVKGVGDKVASCVALFGFESLDAFPIDAYFDGNLDPSVFGEYAGVAQQYIFNHIRNIENK